MPDESKSQPSNVAKIEKDVRAIQEHIIIGCSDARDISEAYFHAMDKAIGEYRANGIVVEVERLSVAGTFATRSTIAEIKSKIFQKLSQYYEYDKKGVKIEFFIHVNTHGDAHLKDETHRGRHSMHDIEVVPNSVINCGMMGADVVAKEIEQLLLEKKPVLKFRNSVRESIRIDSQEKIKQLLAIFYNFRDGSIVDWIKPIYDLSIHAHAQKEKLRVAFDCDPVLRHLGIHITAGIQNYATNEYLRVDENKYRTILDEVYETIRENGKPRDDEHRIAKQSPLIGCFHMTDFADARKSAAEYYIGDQFAANQVFAVGSATLDQHRRPLGAYTIASLFYGRQHLGLDLWPILCNTERQADMGLMRIMSDPLGNRFVKWFDIKLPKTYKGDNGALIAPASLRNAASKARLQNGAKGIIKPCH
ncbi:MAG: hypothetical protein WC263_00985 [Candidatus Micrarchaeia archaeon]